MSFQRQVKTFLRSHKSGTKRALELTLLGIDHMHQHKDWTGLAMMITQTEGRMGPQIRRIIGECLGGVTMKADKTHPSGMRFELGDNWGPTEKLGVLRDLVANGETVFSDAVEQGLLGKKKVESVQKSLDDCREHVQKYLAKHGYTLDMMLGQAKLPAPEAELEEEPESL